MSQSFSAYKKSFNHYFYNTCSAFTIIIVLISVYDANCQDYSVSSDRPTQTDGLTILEQGYIQMELGFGIGNSSDDMIDNRSLFIPNLLLRFGTTEDSEIHFIYDFINERTESGSGTGTMYFHQIGFGSKYHLLDGDGIIPTAILVGNVYLSIVNNKGGEPDSDLDAEIKAIFQNNITDRLSLAYMIRYRGNFAFTIVPSYSLTSNLGLFLEYYSDIRFNSPNVANGINGGLVYLANKHLSVDFLAGTLFTNDVSNFYITTGVAWWIK